MIPVYRVTLTICFVLACAQAIPSTPLKRSVSSSRQFLVFGADVRLRGSICDLAERTKGDVLRLLAQRDEWVTPIVVHAQYPQANWPERPRAVLSVAQTGLGLKLQLDLTIASDATQAEVRRELLRAILVEMRYRTNPGLPAGTAYAPPPDWLLDGILPAQIRNDARSIGILEGRVTARKILSLEEFLRQRPETLDRPGRSLYAAYSFALVDLLLQFARGRERLTRFIADIPSVSIEPMANLGSHFPELSNAIDAEKAWSLHIGRLAISQPFQLLSAEETERKLNELLILKFSEAGSERKYQLMEFAKFIRNAFAKVALNQRSRDLSIFATRAHPIYRPIIHEYTGIVARLAQGRAKGTAGRLARLSVTRTSVIATMRAIDDYLNWFEATQSSGPSGAFVDYLKAAESAAEPGARKRDALSVYLDVLEAQLQN